MAAQHGRQTCLKVVLIPTLRRGNMHHLFSGSVMVVLPRMLCCCCSWRCCCCCCCRSQVEACDMFEGFLMLQSMAGGTGAGVGTHLAETLVDEYGNAHLLNCCIW